MNPLYLTIKQFTYDPMLSAHLAQAYANTLGGFRAEWWNFLKLGPFGVIMNQLPQYWLVF